MSQPTLSAALKQLEADLGAAIVERGNRFREFTPDGEIVLRWARRMLADEVGLKQELDASRGTLKGRLRLGVIPSANAFVPHFTASFASAHGQVAIDETETTSIEILRKLALFELDAGITYIDNEPLEHVRTLPLYAERYVAIIPETSTLARLDAVTWRQASTLPLCLMHRDMQNRRIYDAAFASVGAAADVRIEVYSMMAKLAYLQAGYLASIMPPEPTPVDPSRPRDASGPADQTRDFQSRRPRDRRPYAGARAGRYVPATRRTRGPDVAGDRLTQHNR